MTDETPPSPAGSTSPNAVLLIVGLGTLLSAMGGSTVTLALPELGNDLGITLQQAGWIMESFLLAVTVLLLAAGRAADLLGHGRVYLTGFALFGVTSLICGLAGDFRLLVGARVLQGIAAALVMATGPALLTLSFPPQQRGRALGNLSTATYIGLTLGPPLGGWLVSALGWRWVFYLNVPVALVVVAIGLRALPKAPPRERTGVDWGGLALLVVGMPLVLAAVAEGRSWGWTSAWTLGCAGLGLVALAAFVVVETRVAAPLLDLGLFRSRMFSGATASALLNYVAMFVSIILMPYFLVEARGLETSHAGLLLSAQPLVMALVASPAGWLSDRIGSRGLAVAGMLVMAAGLGWLSTAGLDTPLWRVAAPLAVMGLGTGVFISPNSSALMGAAPRRRQGIAGGVMAVARNLGMMTGVALAMTVFHGAGGHTGQAWGAADYGALQVALLVAAGAAVLAAGAAALRGQRAAPAPAPPGRP